MESQNPWLYESEKIEKHHSAGGRRVACRLCDATAHIVTDESHFVRIDKTFNKSKHYIELANGSRANNVAIKRATLR